MNILEKTCSLCGNIFTFKYLYHCQTCRKLVCQNCFLQNKEGKIECLVCIKKRLYPKLPLNHYQYLGSYLSYKSKNTNSIALTFKRVEEIIEKRLPLSAYNNIDWWANNWNRIHSKEWLKVGWKVDKVNQDEKTVFFTKEKPVKTHKSKKKICPNKQSCL